MLQTVNDENANCLHTACKLGMNKLVDSMIKIADDLSKTRIEKVAPKLLADSEYYFPVKRLNVNILMGMMQ